MPSGVFVFTAIAFKPTVMFRFYYDIEGIRAIRMLGVIYYRFKADPVSSCTQIARALAVKTYTRH